jgi:flagellar basal body-associated protein FliL
MELTRKQIILIAVISGVILLLTVAAVLIFTPGEEEAAPEPTAIQSPTASPEPTPTSEPTPSPTAFRLPLVPRWDTPQPTLEPVSGVFAPY